MIIQALLKRNTYYDSITLMSVIQFVKEQAAVDDAGAVMATEANLALMEQADLLPVAFLAELKKQPGAEDLLIAIRASDEAAAQAALSVAERKLAAPAKKDSSGSASRPTARSLEMALRQDASANLAVISVAGEHAWLETEQALHNGLHVFLFSNNVPVEQERRLKVLAASKGLLLMGPDCGTAIINGVGLGFSNVVPRGNIGIVGASGTGMQQLTCLIAAAGMGISQAIGTGGRDLSEAIDGIMMREGLALLARDPQTEVIMLVSKLPSKRVAQVLLAAAAQCEKPVVAIFLGKAPEEFEPVGGFIKLARTHTGGAELAVSFAGGDHKRVPGNNALLALESRLVEERAGLAPSQRYVRALYSGGTLCYEAMLLLSEQVGAVASNIPLRPEWELPAHEQYRGHTALDLGTDEFTRGKPHPMIDPTVRLQYLARAAQDSETAVILLDIVLGFCSHPNPASVYAPVIQQLRNEAQAAGRSLPVIVSLCGTEGDQQRLSAQRAALEAAGALVLESNEAATFAAASLVIDTKGISQAKDGSHD
jgi:FdrA protein